MTPWEALCRACQNSQKNLAATAVGGNGSMLSADITSAVADRQADLARQWLESLSPAQREKMRRDFASFRLACWYGRGGATPEVAEAVAVALEGMEGV